MAKFLKPILFSETFEVSKEKLESLGVLDPILNIDTHLFIDPLLLSESQHKIFSEKSVETYQKHFNLVIKLLGKSQTKNDIAWRTAKNLLKFPELKFTCLGYGDQSISGSGSGKFTTEAVVKTAKEIIDLGITDPDLFVALALLEKGIGPDLISDMVTNIIFGELLAFNKDILNELNVETTLQKITLKNGNSFEEHLPLNPCSDKPTPIVLVPLDILRDLPIAIDYEDVSWAAGENEILRAKVNKQIGEIWKIHTLKDKTQIKAAALSSKENFETLLEVIKNVHPVPYDYKKDPKGKFVWEKVLLPLLAQEPLKMVVPKTKDVEAIESIVEQIIDQFRFLIQQKGLNQELYTTVRNKKNQVVRKPRPEKTAQNLFHTAAYAYCKANNVDITPEADTKTGKVDFKFSSGFNARVMVEIKLSSNKQNLKSGYKKQLETYKASEETASGYYIVIDVNDNLSNMDQELINIKNELAKKVETVSQIEFIDGNIYPSASKIK